MPASLQPARRSRGGRHRALTRCQSWWQTHQRLLAEQPTYALLSWIAAALVAGRLSPADLRRRLLNLVVRMPGDGPGRISPAWHR